VSVRVTSPADFGRQADPAPMSRSRPNGAPVSRARRNSAALVRLVCFAHAGGGPATFRHWPEALAPDIELWTATLPGRAGRAHEPYARSWQPLIHTFTTAVSEQVAEPVALFGHSLGGLLAFEVARELVRSGDPDPCHLIVSARGAPEVRLAADVPGSDAALIEQVDKLYGGIPAAVREEPELLASFLPILRADIELVRTYTFTPGPPIRCPITVLGGDADPTVSREALAGWAMHTTADHEIHQVAGGHFYIEQQRSVVLNIIRRRLSP
jgi:surfactin synthase thioesterase subunit